MRPLLLLVLLLLVMPVTRAWPQTPVTPPPGPLEVVWQELGPAPIANGSYAGRVSALVCSPTDANRYFVGGADGGIWRTNRTHAHPAL